MKQIAEIVGISTATVSRFLNFDMSLSVTEGTRQKIIETAETMNYEPQQRGQRNKNTRTSGKVATLHFLKPEEELIDPYYVALRLGIERRCTKFQIESIKLYQTDTLLEEALLREVTGVIIIGWQSEKEIKWITSHNSNTEIADFRPDYDDIDAVYSDLVSATRKLLLALDRLEYRRIGFVGWIDHLSRHGAPVPEIRCLAYEGWMKERGRFESDLYSVGRNTEECGYEQTLKMLELGEHPEVIVTANDNMAVGAYRAINQHNLRIPEDIALASFNDISAAHFF